MRIIPAIDIINGKCVRLTRGDYNSQIIYNQNPLEVALELEANGIQYLHLVDLDGARSEHIVNHKLLNAIATKTSLKVDFGGGLKSTRDIEIAFENGATQITGGSVAYHNPALFLEWVSFYGVEKIILGADAYNRKISTNGWLQFSETDVVDFIKDYNLNGINYVICTDIGLDGMLLGPALDLYMEIIQKTNVRLIASGGVATLDDLMKLKKIGCEGAIVGKAIYEHKIQLADLHKVN